MGSTKISCHLLKHIIHVGKNCTIFCVLRLTSLHPKRSQPLNCSSPWSSCSVLWLYVHEGFPAPTFKRWSQVALPWNVCWTYWLASNKQKKVEVIMWALGDPVVKDAAFCLAPSLGLLAPQGVSCHVARKSPRVRNWELLATAAWVHHLRRASSSPNEAFRWLQPQLTSWWNHTRDPEPELFS